MLRNSHASGGPHQSAQHVTVGPARPGRGPV